MWKYCCIPAAVAEARGKHSAKTDAMQAAAIRVSAEALDQFKDARPANLNTPDVPGEKKMKGKNQ